MTTKPHTVSTTNDQARRAQRPAGGRKSEMALGTGCRFSALQPFENKGRKKRKIDLAELPRDLAFERINEAVWKVTDGVGSIQWSGNRSGGYKTARALAWVVLIGNGLWVARYRDTFSPPLKLAAAKQFACSMIVRAVAGRIVADPIRELNRLQCIVEECSSRANAEVSS